MDVVPVVKMLKTTILKNVMSAVIQGSMGAVPARILSSGEGQ